MAIQEALRAYTKLRPSRRRGHQPAPLRPGRATDISQWWRARLGPEQRAAAIATMSSIELDLLVIGLGSAGSAAAQDAALRGLTVGAIDARGIAAGTSSRSSKILHGGLRYLENAVRHPLDGNVALVAEGRSELRILGRIAPHLFWQTPYMFPLTTKVFERPYVRLGMAVYDQVGRRRSRANGVEIPRHRSLTRQEALRIAPGLKPDALIGAVQYYDGGTDDSRLTLAFARSAALNGAAIAPGVQVLSLLKEGDRAVGAHVVDNQTGEEFDIRAKTVINATGVWSDSIAGMASSEARETPRVRASKGVHIVVPADRIKMDTGLILRQGKSVLFVVPAGDRRYTSDSDDGSASPRRHWIIGTTDTDYALTDREHPAVTARDIRQLLDRVNQVLEIPLTENDIQGVFAGLRPLVWDGQGDPTQISRKHVVSDEIPGIVTLGGGKLTILRLMGEDAVDRVADLLGIHAPSRTSSEFLLGGAHLDQLPSERDALAEQAGVTPDWIDLLISRHGSLVYELVKLIASRPDLRLGDPIEAAPSYLRAEAYYAASHEGALNLEDILTRHTHIDFETGDGGLAAAREVAELAADALGWDPRKVEHELETFRRYTEVAASGRATESDEDATGAFSGVTFFPGAPPLHIEPAAAQPTR